MTALSAALVLAMLHTSIVALTTMIAQVCLPRRLAAGRAMVGVVGMACILAVTVLASVPLPSLCGYSNTQLAKSFDAPNHARGTIGPEQSANNDPGAPPASQAHAQSSLEAGLQVSPAWLQRLGDGLQRINSVASAPTRGWRLLVLAIVLFGAGISLMRLIIAVGLAQLLRATSSLIADESIAMTVAGLKRRCGCRRDIELRETSELSSAATFGWWTPVILLPTDWPQWSAEELATVLAHEVAHVHRADYLHRVASLVNVAIHFYHPLVRAAAWRLAVDQELAADQLARDLTDDAQAYARGLAKLSLRYHESFPDRRAWLSVSAMPRSSDYLARRLEMLRVKSCSTDTKATRLTSFGAAGGLIAVALATTLLRGATAADDPGAEPASPSVEAAPPPSEKPIAATSVNSKEPAPELFSREAFDPSMIRIGEKGAYLIRVGDFWRHPEIQPHLDGLNAALSAALRHVIGDLADGFDVREIEWMAGNLIISVGPSKNPDAPRQLAFGSGETIIRTTRSANWQEEALQSVPGSSLKNFDGRSYVQLPVFPALGPAPLLMRSPDDRTLIYHLAPQEAATEERKALFLRTFFDDTRRPRAWHSAWRAVDGGLVTLAFDNSEVGWSGLPGYQKDPEYDWTLVDKTRFFALGCDWTEKSNRTGLRVRDACANQESAKEIHLATMTLLSTWPALYLLEGGESMAKYQQRLLQLLASVKVQPSAAGADEHYVQATAEVGWDGQEFVEILRLAGAWLLQN